ncbi:hypothetical protein SPONN_1129 [uncultured Candidatus Thioglobus sp.]|nr:hypothetical protein SPONN_1129 [uncultured Candidatus Thioglobus sp.]
MTRHLHRFHGKFITVVSLYTKLIEELKDQVPNNLTFAVGYFEGQKHSKVSIVSNDDITAMYSKYPRGEINLWCDARCEENAAGRRKRKRALETVSNYHEGEEQVDEVYKELREKHLEKYDVPKLRLWARMICSNLHESTEEPPKIPAFSVCNTKKPKQDLASALTGAAVAFTKSFGSANASTSNPSPYNSVDMHIKCFEQIGYIKQLNVDNILTDEEFEEHKENILRAIKKLD